MKEDKIKFIKKAFQFWIVFVIIFLIVNCIYTSFIIPQKHIYKNEIQYQENLDKTIIFLGDSFAGRAVNPEYIDNAFNYALLGGSYKEMYYRARKIINENENIEIIVLPIDLHSFSDYRLDFDYIWYWYDFMSISELQQETNKSIVAIYMNKYFPVIGNGEEFKRLIIKEDETEVINGWYKGEDIFVLGEEQMTEKEIKERANYKFKNYPEIIDATLFDAFLNILDMAEENDIKIVLIKYPVTQEYENILEDIGLDKEQYSEEIYTGIEDYENIYVLDYREFYFDNNTFFMDENHLNEQGAEIFSKEINKVFKELNLN